MKHTVEKQVRTGMTVSINPTWTALGYNPDEKQPELQHDLCFVYNHVVHVCTVKCNSWSITNLYCYRAHLIARSLATECKENAA